MYVYAGRSAGAIKACPGFWQTFISTYSPHCVWASGAPPRFFAVISPHSLYNGCVQDIVELQVFLEIL